MIDFIDIDGTRHGAITEYSMRHGVNGEKSLSGTVYTNAEVIHGIDRGWRLEIDNEFYVVTFAVPVDNGSQTQLEFDAVHEFFYDMSKSSVYTTLNGSNTAKRYLDFIFDGIGYEYRLEIDVPAFEKESFGMENRLALFNDFVRSTGVEFVVNNRVVRILREVGTDLSTIVKKGFNMQELRLEKNINEFITYKRGFGAWVDDEDHSLGRLEAVYESPLSNVYRRLEGDPVVDERYTVQSNLEARLQNEVENSYSISVQLIMEDLTKAGYQYKQPRTGDYIMAMNEELGFEQRIRIVSYESHYDVEGNLIDHDVTCNSLGVTQTNSGMAGIRNSVNRALENSERALRQSNYAVISADGKTTNYYGETDPRDLGYEVRYGDTWYQTIGEEKVMNVWNGAEWDPVIDTRDLEANKRAIEAQQQEIQDAKDSADTANQQINNAIQNAGFSTLADLTADIQSISTRADANALAAIDNASAAMSNALTALDNISGLESTVQNINVDIDQINGTLDLKADRQTVDVLSGIVENHTLDIQANAEGLALKADSSVVDTLSGDVSTLSTQVGLIDGELSSKISQTQLQSAIDGIEIGGRNLVVRHNEHIDSALLGSGTNPGTTTAEYPYPRSSVGYSTMRDLISVEPGEYITFSKSGNGFWRYNWLDENYNFIARNVPTGTITETVPNGAYYLWVSYPSDEQVKVERGNKVTDWTPAPEDTLQLISHVETEWRQTAQEINQSITRVETDVNGKASLTAFNTIESKVDGTIQRIGDAEGNITQIEANVNGIHNTVYNPSDGLTTRVSTLASGFNVLSTDFANLEIGGRNLYPNTSKEWASATFGGWQHYFHNISIGENETLNVGDQITWSGVINPESQTGGIMAHFDIAGGGHVQRMSNFISGGTTIKVSGTTIIPENAIRLRLALRHQSGSTPSQVFNYKELKIEKGNKATDWTPAPEDMASQAQLSVLNDNINMRVSKGELMSQINIEAGRTLIQSNRLYLDAQSVVFSGSAFIPGAYIENASIDSAKISEIDASRVRVINMDASAITAGTISGANMFLNLNQGHFHSEGTYEEPAFGYDSGTYEPFIMPTYVDIRDGKVIVSNPQEGLGGAYSEIAAGGIYLWRNPDSAIRSDIYITGGSIEMGRMNSSGSVSPNGVFMQNFTTGRNTALVGNGLDFQTGGDGGPVRHVQAHTEGLNIFPGDSNTGTNANTSIWLTGKSGATGSHQYIDFNENPTSANTRRARIEHVFDELRLRHPNDGWLRIRDRSNNADSGRMSVFAFTTHHSSGETIELFRNRLQTPRTGNRDLFITPQGTGVVQVATSGLSYYNIRASNFLTSSARRLKTDIDEYTESALYHLNQLNIVEYRLKKDLEDGVDLMHVGLIAEDSNYVSDGQSIDTYKLLSLNTKAIQELDDKQENVLKVASHAYLLAEQHEDELEELRKENRKLKERLDALEGAA